MLNGRNFEKLIVNEIKEKVFAESNICDMVKLLDEEIKELVGEQGERLQYTEEELGDMKSSWPPRFGNKDLPVRSSWLPRSSSRNTGEIVRSSGIFSAYELKPEVQDVWTRRRRHCPSTSNP